MRAELYRPDAPDAVVAVATWHAGRASARATDESIEGLDRLLRPTPVVVHDAGPRQMGTSGELLEEPGSPDWFRAALLDRAPALGLAVRFVEDDVRNGWDPAANYRTFEEQERRLASEDAAPGERETMGPIDRGMR